ncbi:hypothetical protein NMG60_11017385 [Bertholletia excelsa]
MFRFICKTFHHLISAVRHSRCRSIYYVPFHPNSKCLESVYKSTNQRSFAASYLINSCGFSPDIAISASRYLKFEDPAKPDSVLAFFKSHGFTKTQISRIVRIYPFLLSCHPEKALLPKIEFLKSLGMSSADVALVLSKSPEIFRRSLRNHIIPSFEFLDNLLQSKEKTLATIKRHARILVHPRTYAIPNIEILQEAGVPQKHIASMFSFYPTLFLSCSNKFREVVQGVKKLGLNPSKATFVVAVRVMRSMSRSTWKKKLEVYKKWGWSEEEILATFMKFPPIMLTSEDKIMRQMDYLVNKMGQDSSCIQRRPTVIKLSLEKRIIPRCELHEILLSKGLINRKNHNLLETLKYTEERFLKFLNYHDKEAPKLLKLYMEKLALAK